MRELYGIFCPMCGKLINGTVDIDNTVIVPIVVLHGGKYIQWSLDSLLQRPPLTTAHHIKFSDKHELIYDIIHEDKN